MTSFSQDMTLLSQNLPAALFRFLYSKYALISLFCLLNVLINEN